MNYLEGQRRWEDCGEDERFVSFLRTFQVILACGVAGQGHVHFSRFRVLLVQLNNRQKQRINQWIPIERKNRLHSDRFLVGVTGSRNRGVNSGGTYGASVARSFLDADDARRRFLDVEQRHVALAVVTDPVAQTLEVDFCSPPPQKKTFPQSVNQSIRFQRWTGSSHETSTCHTVIISFIRDRM